MKKITLLLSALFFTLMSGVAYGIGPSAEDSIFISQNCDPENNYKPDRFAELYNPTQETVDLTGWTLENVQNGSVSFVWSISVSIASGETLVFGRSNATDQTISPDVIQTWVGIGWNGIGGDGTILRNAEGDTIDYAVQADGTGDFENGQMVRNSTVVVPSSTYDDNEWTFSSVTNATDANVTVGEHECVLPAVAAGSEAPTITNFLPAEATTFTLGESFNVSAIVTTTFGSIDSVRFAYGTESSNLGDTSKMMQDVLNQDSFYLPMSIGDVGTYYGQIIAYGSNGTTKSSSITGVIAECGEVEVPVANGASEILATSFTANWAASTGAEGYILDVWNDVSVTDAELINEDFEDFEDWTNISTSTDNTHAGNSAPARALGASADSLISPKLDYVTSLSFYQDASSGGNGKEVAVLYISDQQLLFDTIALFTTNDAGQTENIDLSSISAQTNVQIAFVSTFNTWYLDDVVIKGSGIAKDYILQGDSIKTGTEKEIIGLTTNTTYKYAVTAYNSFGCESDRSNVISVTTGTPTALDDVVSPLQVFTNEGQIIVRSTEELMLQVYDISGRQVARQLLNDQVTIPVKSGIYIVKANKSITKVAVK